MLYDLVIDGGTTNLRVYLIDETGNIITSSHADGGVRHTALDGNNQRLHQLLHDCVQEVLTQRCLSFSDFHRCIAYGMITSNLGLLEIPHLSAPVSATDLHKGMKTALFQDICPLPIEFIPGVRNFYGSVDSSNVSDMDMMRGEETEAIGLSALLSLSSDLLLVLPGSHNKFVHLDAQGRILGCMTSISGELLDAVTHNTILSSSVNSSFCTPETYDSAMAVAGAEECLRSGLGHASFAGRILATLGNTAPSAIQSFLLGAVLAEDGKALSSFLSGSSTEPLICIAGKDPVRAALSDVLPICGYRKLRLVSPAQSAQMGITGARLIAYHDCNP